MKKILYQFLGTAIVVSSYFCFSPIRKCLNQDVNFWAVGRYVAKSLYQDTQAVSSVPIVVQNYILTDGRLYVFPLENKIELPVDSMVCAVRPNELEIYALDSRYTISHFQHTKAKLYEYVYAQNTLATTSDFYIIDGDNLEKIVERFTIYYEKV